jgi:hypothetical protein
MIMSLLPLGSSIVCERNWRHYFTDAKFSQIGVIGLIIYLCTQYLYVFASPPPPLTQFFEKKRRLRLQINLLCTNKTHELDKSPPGKDPNNSEGMISRDAESFWKKKSQKL